MVLAGVELGDVTVVTGEDCKWGAQHRSTECIGIPQSNGPLPWPVNPRHSEHNHYGPHTPRVRTATCNYVKQLALLLVVYLKSR